MTTRAQLGGLGLKFTRIAGMRNTSERLGEDYWASSFQGLLRRCIIAVNFHCVTAFAPADDRLVYRLMQTTFTQTLKCVKEKQVLGVSLMGVQEMRSIAPYARVTTVEWLTLTCSLLEVQVGLLGEHPRWSSP